MRPPSFPAFCRTLCTLLAVEVPELTRDDRGRRRLSLLCDGLRADFTEDGDGTQAVVRMRVELGRVAAGQEEALRDGLLGPRRRSRRRPALPLIVRDAQTGVVALQDALSLRRAEPTEVCARLWAAIEHARPAPGPH